jgi:hypothetical protein
MRVASTEIQFQALVEHGGAVLTVETPAGEVLRFESATALPSFALYDGDGVSRADGSYRWELRLAPPGSESREARPATKGAAGGAVAGGERPSEPEADMAQSGSFRIADGSFVDDEGERPDPTAGGDKARAGGAATTIPDDLLVKGRLYVRNSNPRMVFDDTGPSGFPDNDWELSTNDGAGSGPEKFSIEDMTNAKVPFTITADAPSHSIFVNSAGRIGLGTAFPEASLHLRASPPREPSTTNLSTLRLESTVARSTSVWELVGGAHFEIRNPSAAPFAILSGAPSKFFVLDVNGVGVGTDSPKARLHVLSNGPEAVAGKVLIENDSPTASPRELLELQNDNGQAVMIFRDSTEAERWAAGTYSTNWVLDNQPSPGLDYTFSNSGNFTAAGTITPGSSRTVKQAFAAIDASEILSKVLALPITTWSYKADPGVRHIGPMAEDFFAAFAVGADAKGISVTDSAGVALAAIQALYQELGAKEAQIGVLQERLAALEAAMASSAGH